MAYQKRITNVTVTPTRMCMGMVAFKLKLWNQGQNPDVDPVLVEHDFAEEFKIAIAGVTVQEIVLRIKLALKDRITGWIQEYSSGQTAAGAVLSGIQTALNEIAGA